MTEEKTVDLEALELVKEVVAPEKGKYVSITSITKFIRKSNPEVKSAELKKAIKVLFHCVDRETVLDLNGKTVRMRNLVEASLDGDYEYIKKEAKTSVLIKGTVYNFHIEEKSIKLDLFDENGEVFEARVASSYQGLAIYLLSFHTKLLGSEITLKAYKTKSPSLVSIEKVLKVEDNQYSEEIRNSFKEQYDWLENEAYSNTVDNIKRTKRESTGFKAIPTYETFNAEVTPNILARKLAEIANDIHLKLGIKSELSIILEHLATYLIKKAISINSYYSASKDSDFIGTFSFLTDFQDYLTKIQLVNYSVDEIAEDIKKLEDLGLVKIISANEMTNSAILTLQKFNHDLETVKAMCINVNALRMLKDYYNLEDEVEENEDDMEIDTKLEMLLKTEDMK